MHHIYLPIKTTSPVAIRADHAAGGAATTSYIPGTTLLGSFAAAHRILRPKQQQEFARLFLEDHIFYSSLYPAVFNQSHMGIDVSNVPVRPLPKTAQSCKRFPGFELLKGELADNEKRHGVRDSLLDWAAFSFRDGEKQSIPALLSPFEDHESCKYCQQPFDHISGYYRRAEKDPAQRMQAHSSTRLQTRTGINREWGIVEEDILYNREVFDEDMLFWGEVLISEKENKEPPDENLVTLFTNFVKEASKEDLIRLGTGRTRGLGSIEEIKRLFAPRQTPQEKFANFKDRLDKFHDAVRSQAQKAGVRSDPFYFAITLYSATILCDPFLRYYQALTTNTLHDALQAVAPAGQLSSHSFKKIYQASNTQHITGWNELWGTPRTSDYAIEMGSTFLFSSSHELDNELLQALYTLEETGIGRRRSEGFGRICISDRFHREGKQS